MATPNVFPNSPDAVLNTLATIFKHQKEERLFEILKACTARIEEDTNGYGYYNDNTIAFNLYLEVPPELYAEYEAIFEKAEEKIKEKLPAISKGAGGGSWITSASFVVQMNQVNAPLPEDSKTINDIWKPEYFRLFISHLNKDKVEIKKLKEQLYAYGISAFVAHEDIEVNKAWEHVIMQGLYSMHMLLAVVTPDFHKSVWTNQEVGVALGRGIPVLSVRVGKDPEGFIARIQGMKGELDVPQNLASRILDVILKDDRTKEKMRSGLIEALVHSGSFAVTALCYKKLSVLPALAKEEAERLKAAFNNYQVSAYINAEKIRALVQQHFPRFGKEAIIDENEIPF